MALVYRYWWKLLRMFLALLAAGSWEENSTLQRQVGCFGYWREVAAHATTSALHESPSTAAKGSGWVSISISALGDVVDAIEDVVAAAGCRSKARARTAKAKTKTKQNVRSWSGGK